jgi:outer membrane protein assembly factor BamA
LSIVINGKLSHSKRRARAWLVAMFVFMELMTPFLEKLLAQETIQRVVTQSPAAKEQEFLASYEGQPVFAVQIAGRPADEAAKYEQLLVQQAGQPFSQVKVAQTEAALKAAGNVESVETQVDPDANGVRIVFVLQPAIYFGIFEFPGAKEFPYSQLIQAANYPAQAAFNPSEIDTDRQNLLSFFQREGDFTATVDPKITIDSANAIANVSFQTTLGKRAKFGSIAIEGAPDATGPELVHKLTTLPARFHMAAIRPGKTYHHSTLNKATQFIQSSLAKQGYLGAQVKLSGAEYQATTNRADVHFNVNLGPITQVRVDGAHLWPWTRKSLLPIYQGVGVDDDTVTEGQQALLASFQAKGYFDVQVDSQLKKGTKSDVVLYKITKDKKHEVNGVILTGNATLSSSQLTPNITVEKKHFFSPGKFSDRLAQTSIKNLQAVYQSEGFSQIKVTSAVTRPAGNIQISFRVVEGPRDIVNSLSIEGANTFPQSQFAPDGLKLAAGQPYSQAHVQADRAAILANYIKAGYLISSFHETATAVSKNDSNRINVVYHIFEGPRVLAGNVLTLGQVHTKQRLIDNDVTGIKKGTPLTESELLIAGSNLYDHTGVFDWAEVDPKEPVTTQTTDDVLVKVHESNRNEFTYSFGFEVIDRGGSIPSNTVPLPNLPPVGLPTNFTTSETTFYGPRGTVQYTRNNLRGKGESLSFTGFAGRLDQRGAIDYIDPNFNWSSWKATTSFSFEKNEENPVFSSQQVQGTLQFQRAIDSAKKTTLFGQYAYSKVDLTRVLIPSLVPAQDQHVKLSTLSGNLTRDTRDNPFDEHKGMLDSLELDFNTSKLGSSVDFAKLTGQAAIYREKFHHVIWAASLRIGLAEPFANSYVPLSEAFFSGGGNSLRGFPLDGAGPQRNVEVCPNGGTGCNVYIKVPTGGNELLIANGEARIPLPVRKGLTLVTFYDGGNVFPDVGFHDFTSLYSNNVGIGLRYATPVGPIRIDVGQNLNPVTGITATNYFIGIGQAF